MSKVFVLVGPKVRLDRGGLSAPAPGSVAGLLRLCQAWAEEVGWSITADPQTADALVIGPGVAPPPVTIPVAIVPGGRGIDGFRWALRHVAFTAQWPAETVRYGPLDDHVVDLRRPGGQGPHRVAVLLHGGFWADPWRRDLMDGLAVDLARRGWLTWNVEYRRLGTGGGWPATGNDVVTAIDAVGRLVGARGDELLLVGHSAGAQLALCAAAERAWQVGSVVSLAGLCDLELAKRQELGARAVSRLLEGEPSSDASPVDRLPLGVAVLLAHAEGDPVVPVNHSRHYAAAARAAGDTAELVEVGGSDHFSLIDPAGDWPTIAARLGHPRLG